MDKLSQILITMLIIASHSAHGQKWLSGDLYSSEIFEMLAKDKLRSSQACHLLAKIGDYKNGRIYEAGEPVLGFDSLRIMDIEHYRTFKPYNAYQIITEQAKDAQVVMINEDHGNPQHRVFTKKLLRELYEQGYRYLFLEALSLQKGVPKEFQDTLLQAREYLLDSPLSGFYVREPQFSNMVRAALQLGYEVLGYDVHGKDRDGNAAAHIGKTLRKDPNAKMIIHCGFGHIHEEENSYGSWLGRKIRDSLGIDPFTIDQVLLSENPGAVESPFYSMMNFDKPTAFLSETKELYNGFSDMKHFDMLVYHPRTIYTHNRPSWLIDQEGHRLVEIKTETKDYPSLIKAFKVTDSDEAVPIDTIEKRSKGDPSFLVLPSGQYRIEIKGKGGTVEMQSIEVHIK